MNVLLDECLPRKLKYELKGHSVSTVTEAGWSGKKNGEQNIIKYKIALVLLTAKNNDLDTLKPFIPKVRQILESLKTGHVFKVKL